MRLKLKFYFPEILFGMFLAVAIFAMGVVFESSRHPPGDNQYAHGANNGGTPIVADNGIKITDWLLVLLNFFLVGSTLMLWKANNRSAQVAERALTDLERPFVGVKILEDGLFNLENGVEHKSLRFRLVNYGRTPATITQLFDDIIICQCGKTPTLLDTTTEENKIPMGFIIGADSEAYQLSDRRYADRFSEAELRAFTMGTDDVFFLGFVRYRDIFNNKYQTGFCLKWTVPEGRLGSFPFLFEGEDGYNYTEKEA